MAATCIVTVMVCVTFYQLRQRQQPGKKEYSNEKYVQVSLMDDSDVVIED